MGSEFVRINHAERVFGEKHMIQSQLELLNIANSFNKYKQMRGVELKLKVNLKSKIGETLTAIEKLNRLLPKSNLKELEYGDKVSRKENKIAWEKNRSIQDEMGDLQKRLGELQSGL